MGKNNLPTKKQAELPAYLTQGSALGTENIGMEDQIISRLKIVQGQTTAKGNNKNLRDGMWYHSVRERHLSDNEELDVYFILKWNSRVIFDDNLKFIASEYTDYLTKEKIAVGDVVGDNDPRWMDCINYFVVTRSDLINSIKSGTTPEPLIYTAMSGSLKSAKKLNSYFKAGGRKNIPMFGNKIKASTYLEKFTKGSAYMPVFKPNGFASEKEYEALLAMYKVCTKLASTEAAQREHESEEATIVQDKKAPDNTDTPFDNMSG